MKDVKETKVLGICRSLEILLDGRKFLQGFADEILLTLSSSPLAKELSSFKRELLTIPSTQAIFFAGYKLVIVDLISKLMFELRFFKDLNPKMVEFILKKCWELLEKVWKCKSFGEVRLSYEFKSDIELMILSLLKTKQNP